MVILFLGIVYVMTQRAGSGFVSFILLGAAAITMIYWARVLKKMTKDQKPIYTPSRQNLIRCTKPWAERPFFSSPGLDRGSRLRSEDGRQADGACNPGAHQTTACRGTAVRWDGRDDRGRLLPAGPYLARLTTPLGVTTRRLVIIR